MKGVLYHHLLNILNILLNNFIDLHLNNLHHQRRVYTRIRIPKLE